MTRKLRGRARRKAKRAELLAASISYDDCLTWLCQNSDLDDDISHLEDKTILKEMPSAHHLVEALFKVSQRRLVKD